MLRVMVPDRELRLLPRRSLVRTNALDQGDWNYRPLLGWVSRLRFRALAKILDRPVERILEVGYGSGVFLPHLARRCRRLFAVDVHHNAPPVDVRLRRDGVSAQLLRGSALGLPFATGTFDAVVAVSTLEFVPDVQAAVDELVRVTRTDGRVLAVTPGRSALLDLGLELMTGERGEDTFEGRRGSVVPAFERAARIVDLIHLPPFVHRVLPLYTVVVASPLPRMSVSPAPNGVDGERRQAVA